MTKFYRSKLIRYFYEENYSIKKTQKELDNVYKKDKKEIEIISIQRKI